VTSDHYFRVSVPVVPEPVLGSVLELELVPVSLPIVEPVGELLWVVEPVPVLPLLPVELEPALPVVPEP
jgi:hypothetical protein